jgi:hypothetical protein
MAALLNCSNTRECIKRDPNTGQNFQFPGTFRVLQVLSNILLSGGHRVPRTSRSALPLDAKRAHTTCEGAHMLAVANNSKKKCDDLKAKRNSLFAKYAKHPQDFHLALEIKKLDDEIAECTQQVEKERRSERSASSSKKLQTTLK